MISSRCAFLLSDEGKAHDEDEGAHDELNDPYCKAPNKSKARGSRHASLCSSGGLAPGAARKVKQKLVHPISESIQGSEPRKKKREIRVAILNAAINYYFMLCPISSKTKNSVLGT